MSYNLTNEFIDESFQQLTQISGSSLVNGTGSLITDLDITVTNAATASFLLGSIQSASYASFAETANTATSASFSAIANFATSAFSASQAVTATTALTASFVQQAQTAISASTAIISDTALVATNATSASIANSATTALLATTASHAIFAETAALATTATNSTYSDATVVQGKNLSGAPISKGTPLYFTGSGTNGNIVGVWPADASNPARMPAPGIAGVDLAIEEEGVVLLDGFINGVDTSGFNAGDAVYVAAGGGYTNVRPTGASNQVQALGYIEKVDNINGSGVIKGSGRANDIPNLSQGHFFVGGAGDVGTTVASSSFAKLSVNNSFAGTQTFNNISVNGTGSFAYIQSVTGSAKIIGDAYIVLNNQTPAERYAGIKVIDSGSSPAVTASLEFDGLNNDWFYEYEKAGDPDNFALIIAGPEYGTKGSPTYLGTNKIQKGTGGHHIGDSNISDDGSQVAIAVNTVVTGSVEASNGFIGNLSGTADTAVGADSLNPGNITISGSLLVSSSLGEGFTKIQFPANSNNTSFNILEGGINNDFRGEEYLPSLQIRKANGTFDQQAVAWRLGVEDPNSNYWNRYTIGAWGNNVSFRPSGSDHSSFLNLRVGSGNNYSTTIMDLTADTVNIGDDGYTGNINFGGNGTVTNLNGSVNQVKVAVDTPSNSNTGSIDMSQGNIFQVFIGNTSNRLELNNITEGQAINIIIEQEGSTGGGTVTFAPEFKFAGGTAPTITAAAGSIDMVSGVAVDTGALFCAFSQNLS